MRFRTGKIKQLCVDEPSNTLDPKGEHALFERLRETGARRTMIFVTHRFGHLTKYADIIIEQPRKRRPGLFNYFGDRQISKNTRLQAPRITCRNPRVHMMGAKRGPGHTMLSILRQEGV
ncbi:hypothetical protein B0H10DRAFT_2201231 [Mycena sp. CBHHK59/15]|nr:hypothetical protein B0H10DRAFT_2201231 [Mycena sp. CBHHK59/15]